MKVPTIAQLREMAKPLDVTVGIGTDDWGDPQLQLIDIPPELIAVFPCAGPTSTSYRRARVYAAAVLAVIPPRKRERS